MTTSSGLATLQQIKPYRVVRSHRLVSAGRTDHEQIHSASANEAVAYVLKMDSAVLGEDVAGLSAGDYSVVDLSVPGVLDTKPIQPRACAVGIIYAADGWPKISPEFVRGLAPVHRKWVDDELQKRGFRLTQDFEVIEVN